MKKIRIHNIYKDDNIYQDAYNCLSKYNFLTYYRNRNIFIFNETIMDTIKRKEIILKVKKNISKKSFKKL